MLKKKIKGIKIKGRNHQSTWYLMRKTWSENKLPDTST